MEPTTLIGNAYRLVMEGQLAGFPAWADREFFDIEAKADEDPTLDLTVARERNLLRLQSLLASRFQLRSHWESKVQHGYALAIGKKGPKLKRSDPGSVHQTRQGQGTLFCTGCSIANLEFFLSNFVKRPVQDETGIQGIYDFNFAFEPFDYVSSSDSGLPSLFTVLEDQLGLKLEPRNIVVQTLIVDHLEHPSSN